MTTWTIIGGIIGIVTFIISLITITVKVVNYINIANVTTAKLTVTVDHLDTTMQNMNESFQRSKDHIWDELNKHSDKLEDHDKRIIVIEQAKKIKKGA